MFVLVLAAEADETRQAITFLILCLVGIAVLLALLTVWYWLFTSPKRRSERLLNQLGHFDERSEPGVTNTDGAELVGAGVGSAVGEEHALPGPAILSESTELMSSMLAETPLAPPPKPTTTPAPPATSTPAVTPASAATPAAAVPGPPPPSESDRVVPPTTAAPHRIEVAERCSSPVRRSNTSTPPLTSPGIGSTKMPARPAAVTRRLGLGDELARERTRRTHKPRQPSVGNRQPVDLPSGEGSPVERVSAERPAVERGPRTPKKPAAERPQEVLSDDDWAAIMKSAFDQMNR